MDAAKGKTVLCQVSRALVMDQHPDPPKSCDLQDHSDHDLVAQGVSHRFLSRNKPHIHLCSGLVAHVKHNLSHYLSVLGPGLIQAVQACIKAHLPTARLALPQLFNSWIAIRGHNTSRPIAFHVLGML